MTHDPIEIVEGAILSDVSLFHYKKGIRANLAQSGREHIDWMVTVAQAFLDLGVIAHCKVYNGDKYPGGYCYMWTRGHPLLFELRDKWYISGRKEVPGDFELTPVSTAHWFMGDGSSTYQRRSVLVKFSTQGFCNDSMDKLIACLGKLDVPAYRNKCGGGYEAIFVGGKNAVNTLMNTVEEYVVPSYKYKLKSARL